MFLVLTVNRFICPLNVHACRIGNLIFLVIVTAGCNFCVLFLPVSGLGFGIISGAFSLVNVLADMVGPGTIGIHGDSKYFFIASGKLSRKGITTY